MASIDSFALTLLHFSHWTILLLLFNPTTLSGVFVFQFFETRSSPMDYTGNNESLNSNNNNCRKTRQSIELQSSGTIPKSMY
jgi:hypothetical protein